MSEPFGEILRRLRLDADGGLREVARQVGISPGYLSDVEQGKVPPPSEEIIVKIAEVLEADRQRLLRAARKIDPELSSYVSEEPLAADFLRLTKEKGFKDGDWQKLSQLVEIANLGNPERKDR